MGGHREKGRFSVARVALLAVVVAGGFVGLGLLPNGEVLPDGTLTAEFAEQHVRAEVRAEGELRAQGQRALFAEVPGLVVRVAERRGEVEQGELLVEIDDRQVRHDLRDAEVALAGATTEAASAHNRREQARTRMDRSRRLANQDLVPWEEFEQARAEYLDAKAAHERAEGEVRRARSNVDRARRELEKTRVESPFAGVVLSLDAEPGELVSAGASAPVATVAPSLERMQMYLDVHEADISRVQVGQRVEFAIEARQDRDFSARVVEVERSGRSRDGVRVYRVIADAGNEDGELFPGMTVRARIDVGDGRPHPAVPAAALLYQPPAELRETHEDTVAELRSAGKAVVWVLDAEDRVRPEGVRIRFQDDRNVALEEMPEGADGLRVLMDE